MFLSALFSFLGGSAFRMIWGEISSWLTKAQDHTQELERMRLQNELDAANHSRVIESLRLQNELKLQVVHAEMEAAIKGEEAKSFTAAQANFNPKGNKYIESWNAGIRPAFASVALLLWMLKLYTMGFKMDAWDLDMVGAIAGFFFADRSLGQRGK